MNWTDIDDIVIELDEAYPEAEPLTLRFPELRAMVEGLDGFEPDPDRGPNEQILEAIQSGWIEERRGGRAGPDEPGYRPHNPFR